MGWKGWLACVGVAWIVLRAERPAWYQDLMLRAFAQDQIADPGTTPAAQQQFEQAADLAARYLLPVGWVLVLAEKVSGVPLEVAVQRVQQAVLAKGPPLDTQNQTLVDYKQSVLAAGGA